MGGGRSAGRAGKELNRPQARSGRHSFSIKKSGLALTALGSAGILALIPVTAWQIAASPAPPLSPIFLAAAAAIQPLLLLLAGAFVGARLAPPLGLRSLVAERANGRPVEHDAFRGLGRLSLVSLLFGLAMNFADELTRPLWLPSGSDFPPYADTWSPITLAFGMLYGGITEEVMFRWGAMSFLAWLLWRAAGRILRPGLIAAAIGGSAVLFAAGHLPAVAALIPLTTGPVTRTLVLNGLAGLWLGWIFWRRHLEAAMLCHAALHVGFAFYAIGALAFR